MTTQNKPHGIYLFDMTNSKKKLAYGKSPEDALEILRLRLTEEEMTQIKTDTFCRIGKKDIFSYIDQLG
jgi:hypothetical protein